MVMVRMQLHRLLAMAGRQGHTPALTVEISTVSYAEFCQDALAFGGCVSSGSLAARAGRL